MNTKKIVDKFYKDDDETEDDFDDDCGDVFASSTLVITESCEKALMESTRKHYPNDGGLLYIAIYLGEFDKNHAYLIDNFSYIDLARLIKIYKTLIDPPSFLRDRLKAYFERIGQNLNISNLSIQSKVDHDYYRSNEVRFIECSPVCFEYVVKLIKYHYSCELNNESAEFITYTSPPVVEAKSIIWYDTNVLRQGLGKGKENSTFIAKILCTQGTKEVLTIADEIVFDTLERDFPNFKDVINFYKAQFRLCALTGRTRISPILLLGPPGVGKTMFSKKLAQSLKTGFTFIDMASASSAWVLSGLHATWHGAKSGKIFDAMLYSSTASPNVVLDEIEKPVNPERDPKNALYQLLEEKSASEFVDEFVDYPVNLSSIIYIACANGLEGISEPLLTRFKIFDIAPPSSDEQARIIKKMYLDEIEGSDLFSIYLDIAIVDSLLTDSLREVKSKISDAVGMALLEYTPAEIISLRSFPELEISLELRHFKNHHKKTFAKLGF